MDVAHRPLRVGEVLLPDQDERTLGHPADVDGALGGGEFGEAAADVHGARTSCLGVRPGHASLDGEVDLECRWPRTESRECPRDPRWQSVAEDGRNGARSQVEHRDVGRRQLGSRGDPHSRFDRPTEIGELCR